MTTPQLFETPAGAQTTPTGNPAGAPAGLTPAADPRMANRAAAAGTTPSTGLPPVGFVEGLHGATPVSEGEAGAGVALPLRNEVGEVIAWTLVDADLYPALSLWHWSLSEGGYAVRSERLPGGTMRKLRLHRVVMCCVTGDGLELDHINRNSLDNRRRNLRFVTHAENMQNRADRPWRAALPVRHKLRWQARYQRDGIRVYLGNFPTFCGALRALTEEGPT